ncbi:MAG: protoporphyrinogen oxidase [Actinomycetes bacterium]
MYDVAIVGGGIAGLAAAYALSDRERLLLLDAAPEVGGKLRVSAFGDTWVDEGAEQVLVRTPEALDLIQAVGLAADVVHPQTSSASVWSRGALRELPGGTVLGVPADPVAVARSGVLPVAGLLRAAADAVLPRTPIDGDVAVGSYVGARAGRAVVDRLVDPLLGGVYAGRADSLSLAATVPQLAAEVHRHRTLLGAAKAVKAATPVSAGPVFAGLRGGLGRLPAAVVALVQERGGEVRTGTTVRGISRTPDGFRLTLGAVPVEEYVETRSVVLAVPATPAARMLRDIASAAATATSGIEYASVAIVTLAYREPLAVRGSGVLVPAVEGRSTKALTYLSSKWRHLSGDLALMRASVGRYGEAYEIQRDDSDLVAVVHADLRAMLGVRGEPVLSRVSRWGGALPQYAPGHLDLVRRVREALPAGIVVCGAAYDGVGVPACIRSGFTAAAALREWSDDRRTDHRTEAEGA